MLLDHSVVVLFQAVFHFKEKLFIVIFYLCNFMDVYENLFIFFNVFLLFLRLILDLLNLVMNIWFRTDIYIYKYI